MIASFLLCAALAGAPTSPQSPGRPGDETLASLKDGFAAWQVDALTRDDGPASLTQLRALVAGAEARLRSNPQDSEAAELLAQLYTSELQTLERARRFAPLQARLGALLGQALAKAPDAGAEALARAAADGIDPALVERVFQQTARLVKTQAFSPVADGELIAAAIQDALEAGDSEFIQQLGTSAVPTLVALAERLDGTRSTETELDPLLLLKDLDPAAALDVALQHASSGDILRKSRVLRAFGTRTPLLSDRVWNTAGEGRSALIKPEWVGIVTGLLAEPAVPRSQVDPYVAALVSRNADLPELVPVVTDWFTRNSAAWRPVPSLAVQAARELLASSDHRDQERGVRTLLLTLDATAVLDLAGSPSESVREPLATVFGPREAWTLGADGMPAEVTALPTINPKLLTALDTFVRVGNDSSSRNAVSNAHALAMESGTVLVGPERFVQWLELQPADDDSWFLPLIKHLDPLDGTQRAQLGDEIAAWISSCPDGRRRNSWINSWMNPVARLDGMEGLLAAARSAEAHAPTLAGARAVLARLAPELLEREPQRAGALFDHLESLGGDAPWASLVEAKRTESGFIQHHAFLANLAAADQQRLVRNLWSVGYDGFGWLGESELPLSRGQWLELVADAGLSPEARAWAMSCLSGTSEGTLPSNSAEILAGAIAAIGSSPVNSSDLAPLGIDPQAVLGHLLDMPRLPEATLLGFYVALEDPVLVDRVHARFPASTWAQRSDSSLIASLVRALVKRGDPDTIEDLKQASQPNTVLQRTLIESIAFRNDRVHLPVAAVVLHTDYFSDKRLRASIVDYVAGFLDDEAAGLLIDAARKTRIETYRQLLFDACERILAWQEAETRWRRGSGGAARRDAAITELVRLLDDPQAAAASRVEAVRGLAALGAAEEIPRLIRLLDADSEDLRAAAQASLDALNGR